MIIATSTYEQMKQHLLRHEKDCYTRILSALSGHQGRALRKGTVKRWPAVYFARFNRDHNTYTACIAYPTRADYKRGRYFTGICVEYETDQGKQLVMLNHINSFSSFITVMSAHAIKRVRERLYWQDIDWYTLVQRICVMMDGAYISDIHKGGDQNEISYTCQKGEFCGCNIGNDILIRTFIGNDQMCEWRDRHHTANREWMRDNIPFLQSIAPSIFNCMHNEMIGK